MAEETKPAEPKEEKKKQPRWFDTKEGFRPSAKMLQAIHEVLGRERLGFRPDYKNVADHHDVKPESLRRLMFEVKRGKLDISAPPDEIDKRETAMRAENEKSLLLLQRYERVLNNCFELKLKDAEKEIRQEKPDVGKIIALDIAQIVRELNATRETRIKLEKGVLAILERLMEMQNRRDQLHGVKPGNLTQNNVTVHINGNGHQEKPPEKVITPASPVGRAELTASADESAIFSALPKK